MSNKKEIIQFIKDKIKQNTPKAQIQTELSSKYEVKEYEKILKDFPEPELKERYKVLNGLLITFTVIITLIKVLSILSLGAEFGAIGVSAFLVIGLFINVAIIIYLLSYRASAYLLAFTFTVLSISKVFEGGDIVFSSGSLFVIGIYLINIIGVLSILILSIILFKKVHPDYRLFSK